MFNLFISLGSETQGSHLDKWGAEPTLVPSCKSLQAVEVDGSCLRPQSEGTQQTAMSFLFQETSHLKVL